MNIEYLRKRLLKIVNDIVRINAYVYIEHGMIQLNLHQAPLDQP